MALWAVGVVRSVCLEIAMADPGLWTSGAVRL